MTVSTEFGVRAATAADRGAVVELLLAAKLPVADLDGAPGLHFWVVTEEALVIAAIGLERAGPAGLIRSLAVSPEHRQRGLGRRLVARLEREALAQGVEQLVLLTETAATFFERLGYRVVDRRHVPERIRESAEFRSLCPASATCMAKTLLASRVGSARG